MLTGQRCSSGVPSILKIEKISDRSLPTGILGTPDEQRWPVSISHLPRMEKSLSNHCTGSPCHGNGFCYYTASSPDVEGCSILFKPKQNLWGSIARRGILHRDIKPSNILMDSPNGPAYLADFGISWKEGDRSLPTGPESKSWWWPTAMASATTQPAAQMSRESH
jgi:serine/threonine protein kinase